jgi:general secretion pathway protein F
VAVFAYKGVDARGKPVTGAKESDSPKSLRAMLRREGVIVTDVSEAKGGKGAAAPGATGLRKDIDLGFLFKRVSRKEITLFTRQLATLLRAGIPLAESLGAIFDQLEKPKMKTIVGEVRMRVNEGSALGDAMAKHPEAFEEVYVSMVRSGETAGNLDAVLARLADFLEAQGRIRSKVLGAMIYPILMGFVSTAIMVILMVAVVPRITQIYSDAEKTLPWNTRFLIWMSHSIAYYWYLWGVAIVGIIVGFIVWKQSPGGRKTWDSIKLHLPIVGGLTRQIAIGRFCRTFGTMLASGVPLLRALDVSKAILANRVLQHAIEMAREQIQQGAGIAQTLKKTGHFPSVVTHMIAVGERAGQLEQMLGSVADDYESDVEAKLGRLTTLLEPLMIVVLGGAVAFIVFSILMPIMDLNPTMGG